VGRPVRGDRQIDAVIPDPHEPRLPRELARRALADWWAGGDALGEWIAVTDTDTAAAATSMALRLPLLLLCGGSVAALDNGLALRPPLVILTQPTTPATLTLLGVCPPPSLLLSSLRLMRPEA
jgi:hypothetical protein